jgi:hypothetical protein
VTWLAAFRSSIVHAYRVKWEQGNCGYLFWISHSSLTLLRSRRACLSVSVHFFDGFHAWHEVNKIEMLTEEDMRALISMDRIFKHISFAMTS